MTLYNLHTDGDQYRITKFVDGDVESSYLCTETECECPAGHRPSCRHRQMLPELIARHLCDTHWFWDFDRRCAVDINGTTKASLDNMAAREELAIPAQTPEEAIEAMSKCDYWNGRKSLSDPESVPAGLPAEQDTTRNLAKQRMHAENYSAKPWRRL